VPQLRPFAALRYDPSAVGDVGAVLCPPYDVIDAPEREALARVAHNAVALELPAATAGADRYDAAARLLAEWQSAGVLRLDRRPMVYVYEQRHRLPGAPPDAPERLTRGFFCRLQIEAPGGGVLRHERTMSGPREDRFRLLEATRCNLSPVLMLYRSGSEDAPGMASAQLLERLTAAPPDVDTHAQGAGQRMWAIEPGASPAAAELLALAAAQPLAIADGHHRYETALRYRDEVGGPGAEYVLVLLYDADSGGLGVLPTHRLLRVPDVGRLTAALWELFEFESIADPDALGPAVEEGGAGTIGMWTRDGGLLLRPRAAAVEPLLPAGSSALRRLDVTVLATALEYALGNSTAQLDEQGRLMYTKDAADALAQVGDGAADACFLLNATPVGSVLEVASAGELMPPKSTYFVPKAATGLVFNLLSA
jgi:uncharacterized protein (DUF1015 family)